MRPCEDCHAASQNLGYRIFNPACLWCGGRILATIQRLPKSPNERSTRCKAMLAAWMGYGHDEQLLRALAKEPCALQPQPGGQEKTEASGRQTRGKRP